MLPEQDADQVESKVNPSALLTPEVILIPTQDTSQELASVDTPKQQTPEDTLDTGFGGYMKKRRAKLAVQAPAPSEGLPQIFAGITVHVNGWTSPSVRWIREAVCLRGGKWSHYCDKPLLTHIIASNLTPAKWRELKSIPVVKASWVVESVERGILLPWREHALRPPGSIITLDLPKVDPSKGSDGDRSVDKFVEECYAASRLHHLSAWRLELQDIVASLSLSPISNPEIIMHIDMDCFFASVSLLSRPSLIGRPVGISHGGGKGGKSDIAGCNYLARAHGLRNGMQVSRALTLCPSLVIIPYEFDAYRRVSRAIYEIFSRYAGALQAVSCDEALLGFAAEAYGGTEQGALALAQNIRDEILQSTACNASIGIAPNILLAKVATRLAKPHGQKYLSIQEAPAVLGPMSVRDLPGVGWTLEKKMVNQGIFICGDLLPWSLPRLQGAFGKGIGRRLWEQCRGTDNSSLKIEKVRQSIGTNVTWGIRFTKEHEPIEFISRLTREVAARAAKARMVGSRLLLRVYKRQEGASEPYKFLGHGQCDIFNRNITLPLLTGEASIMEPLLLREFKSLAIDPVDMRGASVQLLKCQPISEVPAGKERTTTADLQGFFPCKEGTGPVRVALAPPSLPMTLTRKHARFEDTLMASDDTGTPRARSKRVRIALPTEHPAREGVTINRHPSTPPSHRSRPSPTRCQRNEAAWVGEDHPDHQAGQNIADRGLSTLTQSWGNALQQGGGNGDRDGPIDLFSLSLIPNDIQAAIVWEDLHRRGARRLEEEAIQASRARSHHTLASLPPPSLGGEADLLSVRRLLVEWMEGCGAPKEDDFLACEEYLENLVEYGNLTWVQAHLRTMKHHARSRQAWITIICRLRSSVEARIRHWDPRRVFFRV